MSILRLVLDVCGMLFIAQLVIAATIVGLAWNSRRRSSWPEDEGDK